MTIEILIAATLAVSLPSQTFRDTHKEVKAHLAHVAEWNGSLARSPDRKTAEKIVAFFEQHIKPHAEWEEEKLYPVVDKLAGTTAENRFTSTMRYVHRVVGRWIGELAGELKKPKPDYTAFARRADNLLGLIQAHFEEEEEVLLQYADAKLTREQFEEAVGGHH